MRGKAELRAYFEGGLAAAPELRFELTRVTVGVDRVALAYCNHRGQDVVEVKHLDAEGRCRRGVVHYA